MANLDWPRDVLIIAGVATAGFTFLSYWFSALMASRGWNWQLRASKKKRA